MVNKKPKATHSTDSTSSPQAGSGQAGKKDRIEKDLMQLEQEVENLTTDLQRTQADFINYKRRAEEEQAQVMELAKETVIGQLLPLLDDIERALGHVPKELAKNAWAQGVVKVARQVEKFLMDLGVQAIKAEGEEFNPELHEAVGYEDGNGEHEVVIEELRTGYKMGDRVIRPSMVKVGKAKDE